MTRNEVIYELECVKIKFEKEHPIVGVGVLRVDMMAEDCLRVIREDLEEIEELKKRLAEIEKLLNGQI